MGIKYTSKPTVILRKIASDLVDWFKQIAYRTKNNNDLAGKMFITNYCGFESNKQKEEKTWAVVTKNSYGIHNVSVWFSEE